VSAREGKNGTYAVVELSDPTGTLSAKCFNEGCVAELVAAGAVDCKLKIQTYNGSMSAIIQSFDKADLSPDEVLRFAGLDPDVHKANVKQLEAWRSECDGTVWGEFIEQLFADGSFDELCMAAGAVSMHHARPGGLAQHLVEVGRFGLAMLDATGQDYDRAFFLAGVFAHDIGKLDVYTAPPTIAWTAQGRMAEHQVFSVLRVGKALAHLDIGAFCEAKLVHIIEQAHGEHRQTMWLDPIGPECKALAAADNFSAKLSVTDKERTAGELLDGMAEPQA
jgi:3'-5' exoribonuclease